MNAEHFNRCPAKRGHGAERKALLAELRQLEVLCGHCALLVWVERRKHYEAEKAVVIARLQEIVGQPRPDRRDWKKDKELFDKGEITELGPLADAIRAFNETS